MDNSFNEYEAATIVSEGRDKPAPAAPELPGPNSPRSLGEEMGIKATPAPMRLDLKRAWRILLLLCALVLISLGTWLGVKYVAAYEAKEIITTPLPPPVVTEYIENPTNKKLGQEVGKLLEQVKVLKQLLTQARRVRTADEKYHRLMKYAIAQFYSRPFKPGESSRTICFTTEQNDPRCYSVQRPAGYELDVIAPSPGQLLRRL